MAQVVTDLRRAFPDLTMSVDDLVATGDRVIVRFTARGTHIGPILGANGHGEAVTVTGAAVYRMADRQIVETWVTWDVYGLAEQVGLYLLPAPTDGSWNQGPGRIHSGEPR
jgi:predicted ester cyclase